MNPFYLTGLIGVALWVSFSPVAVFAGSSIGLKFGGEVNQLSPDESCGVVAQQNWCNLSGATGSQEGLTDAQGNKTTAKVEWSSPLVVGKPAPQAAAIVRLLKGYLDGGSGGHPATVTISGIPYQRYTAYVYFTEGDKARTVSTYTVNGVEIMIIPGSPKDGLLEAQPVYDREVDAEKRGTYLELKDQVGNFEIVTDNKGWQYDSSGDFRSPISAIQIVESDK
ncbi:hypothetical protein TSACC_23042 [Terrimicrobium sacchariphilum]|uniref:Uncharacterized protein n=1 Tax=Terrimicrobium sacchariphilum TaxID=690879 RepID=A0A146GB02_TERSA|nr:hypothetical protein [Terrimicrobium sacchariphilum]GAT34610.1 hypothetical protein TSACC_23042 [Terrimicrobium sacchariphilum]